MLTYTEQQTLKCFTESVHQISANGWQTSLLCYIYQIQSTFLEARVKQDISLLHSSAHFGKLQLFLFNNGIIER